MSTGYSTKQKVFLGAVLLIGIFLIVKLSLGVVELLKIKERVGMAEQEVEKLKEEQIGLKDNLEYYQSDLFVEREIRDKLGLSKPGEVVVVLPEVQLEKTEQAGQVEEKELANWEKWWRLFF